MLSLALARRAVSLPRLFAAALCALALASSARAQCGDEVVLHYLDAGTSEPRLRTPRGAPVIGGDFAFRIENGASEVLGVLLYSGFENPIFDPGLGATVWPDLPWFTWFFFTSLDGDSPLVLDTPEVTDDLCGAQATFQAVLFDASAPSGLTISNAVRLRVGSVSEPLFVFPQTTFGSGPPFALAFGDMNGDGLDDLVMVELPDITVRLASIGGGYGAPSTRVLTGINPSSVDLADLDGDTHLDAVVANIGTNPATADNVSVLLGNGAGGFVSETKFTAGLGPIQTVLADFDASGTLDIAVANSQDSRISVLSGNGLGAFAAPQHFFAGAGVSGSGPVDVQVADFDENGDADLIAALQFGDIVSVLLGSAGATFGAPNTLSILGGPSSVAVGDFDDDTHVDFAVEVSDLEVRLGNGDGTFGSALRLKANASAVQVADLNGDLVEDLVSIGGPDITQVSLGLGDGTFATPRRFLCGSSPVVFGIADVDRDGALDVVTDGPQHLITYLLGNGDGTLQSHQEYLGPTASVLDVEAADVDLDGDLDLLAVVPEKLRVFLGSGDGSLDDASDYWLSVGSNQRLRIEDLDLDGAPDVLTTSPLQVLMGNGDGSFAPTVTLGLSPHDIVSGDLDGDFVPDLVAAQASSVSLMLGNGDGTFSTQTLPSSGSNPTYGLARIDGDSDLDLVAGVDQGFLYFLPGNGDGTFGSAATIVQFSAAPGINSVSIADMNRDGVNDLNVWAASVLPATPKLYYLQGNGDGTFQAPVLTASTAFEPSFADVDEDGTPDRVMRVFFGMTLAPGNGDGTFGSGASYPVNGFSFDFADLDGDGVLDALSRFGGVAVLINALGE